MLEIWEILWRKISSKLKKKVVIGTTGFTKKEEELIKKYSKKIPILKAGNMSLGINLLMYLTEIVSSSLGNNFLSKVYEVHHKHKKDHPSGTALMLGKGIAVGKKKDFYRMIGNKYFNKKTLENPPDVFRKIVLGRLNIVKNMSNYSLLNLFFTICGQSYCRGHWETWKTNNCRNLKNPKIWESAGVGGNGRSPLIGPWPRSCCLQL